MNAAWPPDLAKWRQPAGCRAPWAALLLLLLAAVLGWPAAAAQPGPAAEGATAASAPAPKASRLASRVLREQRKAAAFARRQQAAQAHREAVLARIQQQDALRPPARPLPLPLPVVKGAPAAASAQALPARP